jgi:hypothetical protein
MKERLSETWHLFKLFFKKNSFSGKVFCIGYNKTGTTTVGKAFELLGYRNSSFNKRVWRVYYKQKQIDKIIAYTAKFDSFDDLPWLKEDMIPIMDEKFPNSKFIYLERDEASWKKSYNDWTYNMSGKKPDVDKGWENYLNHRSFVLNYFKDRPKDFLTIIVSEKGSFKKMADFLGKKAPFDNFPHHNKTVRE